MGSFRNLLFFTAFLHLTFSDSVNYVRLAEQTFSFTDELRWLSRFTTGGWICVPSGAPCVSDETQRLNFFHTFIAEHLPLKPKWRLQIQSGRTVLQIGKIKDEEIVLITSFNEDRRVMSIQTFFNFSTKSFYLPIFVNYGLNFLTDYILSFWFSIGDSFSEKVKTFYKESIKKDLFEPDVSIFFPWIAESYPWDLENFIEWFKMESNIAEITNCFSNGSRMVCETNLNANTKHTDKPIVLIFEFSVEKKINYVWVFTHETEVTVEEFFPPPVEVQYWKYLIPFLMLLILLAWRRAGNLPVERLITLKKQKFKEA